MDEKRWDLHMHSTCSDGVYTPKELIDEAKAKGLTGISITDHDTISAYTLELFSYAQEQQMDLIPGVEFSTMENDVPVHILGYHCTLSDPGLLALIEAHKQRRRDRNLAILQQLKKYGVAIELEDLEKFGAKTIGRPHIAKLMMEKKVVSSIQEAFQDWIGDKKKCYVKGQSFSPEETIKTIHQAKGVAVLAHPILLKKRSLIRKFLKNYSFDGMEGYYAAFSGAQNEEMCKLAKEFDLIVTGGSDFHGDAKPYLKIGSSYTSNEQIDRLKQRACLEKKK